MNRLPLLKAPLLLAVLLLASASGWAATSVSKTTPSCGFTGGAGLTCRISGQNLTCEISKNTSFQKCFLSVYATTTSTAPDALTNVWFPNTSWVDSPDRVCASGASGQYCWAVAWTSSAISLVLNDHDGDGIINSSDPDDDNDSVFDSNDNCSLIANLNQLNTDGDSQGDVCDSDDDNDGIPDTTDQFPLDTDNDGVNNSMDWDDDNDGVPDTIDAAPLDNANTSELALPLDGAYKGGRFGVDKQAQ